MVKPTETEIQTLADSFLNGNISYVVDEIATMAPANAAYVTGWMTATWIESGLQHDAGVLLRAIGRRIED